MKGDFSRLTGRRAKSEHYSGVLKQQGRVQLDSDWNELIDIIAHQRRTRTIDTIGQCGAPFHNSGFEISHPGNGLQDFLISTGRIYVGGLLCELNPASKIPILGFPANNKITVENLKLNGDTILEGQWIAIYTDESPKSRICQIKTAVSTNVQLDRDVSDLAGETNPYFRILVPYSMQPDYPDAPSWNPVAGQTDLIYLDVWERHITALEDPEIRETALGGPDTDTRTQTIAQVKIFHDVGDVHCPDSIPDWDEELAASAGRLKTEVAQTVAPPTPCELGESGGYNGLENHLYRVEIHEGGTLGMATFKWSRDNGSDAYSIEEFLPGNKIRLSRTGRDEILKIQENDWLEISGDTTELDTTTAGTIVQVTKVDETLLTLSADVSAYKNEEHPLARRWHIDPSATSPLTKTASGPISLEHNIQLSFSGGPFREGDYWVFTARASTGQVQQLEYELPHGVEHNYCKLALITWRSDGTAEIDDCRPEFRPLTEISAWECCCTVTVGKYGDFHEIQDAVDAIGEGPGTICVLPGTYPITEPITVKGQDITIRGCGDKTLILNLSEEPDTATVFRIDDSQRININDLWAVSLRGDRAIVSSQGDFIHINNSVVMALGSSEDSGAIVFRGDSIAGEVRNCLVTGIVGVRFEPLSPDEVQYHAFARIEQNTIFAMQSAIRQLDGATFIGCHVAGNRLFGYHPDSLMKVYFPLPFVAYAREHALFDPEILDKAEQVDRDDGGIATVTKSSTAPVYLLANYLNELSLQVSADAVSTVIALLALSSQINIRDNTLVGRVGISSASMVKSILRENTITAGDDAVLLNTADGLSLWRNKIAAGKIGISATAAANSTFAENIVTAGQDAILLNTADGLSICSNRIAAERRGISATSVSNSMFNENTITAGADAVLLNTVDGLSVGGNGIVAGKNGICSLGRVSTSISLKNNRIQAEVNGIEFTSLRSGSMHRLDNVEVKSNTIKSSRSGISVDNPSVFFANFAVCDNSITGCKHYGIILRGLVWIIRPGDDAPGWYTLIQRNLIEAACAGIKTNADRANVCGNNIRVAYEGHPEKAGDSFGIIIEANHCTIADNFVHGIVDPDKKIFSRGGILINIEPVDEIDSLAIIDSNRIQGGIGNGVEIASNLDGGRIDTNKISDMNLNGVAVAETVTHVHNLSISNNDISNCLGLTIDSVKWWCYAGIVLSNCAKTQILGNSIYDNGRNITDPDVEVGGIFVDLAQYLTIADNKIIDNGPSLQPKETALTTVTIAAQPSRMMNQAMIHIPGHPSDRSNDHVTLTGNTVKGSYAPALILGLYWKYYDYEGKKKLRYACGLNAVVSGNSFESTRHNVDSPPTVQLQCNLCVFSNNLVTSRFGSVDIGFGWFMTVIGNVTAAPITGAGLYQELAHNLSLT